MLCLRLEKRKNSEGDNVANGRNGNNGRLLDDWLSSYADYTEDQESPSLFHFWVGTSVIAATLERKCCIHRGYYTLYPNLYVVLIGASARVRKTSAINMGFEVYREAIDKGVMVSQKTTPEALISIFVEGFKERGVSGGVIVSDELGVFLGGQSKNMDLMQLLTKWYDCPKHFEYHTMMRGKEIMDQVYCNMIAGTTPQWLKDSLPPHAVGGGFTSRIIFVYQDKPEKLVPFPEMTPKMVTLRNKLIHDLRIISRIGGQFRLTEKAREWFSDWYTQVFKPETTPYASLDGYFGRKHDTLLKVAMCLSASKSNSLVVGEIELKMALRALNKNEQHLPDTLRLIQMTEVGEEMEKVYRVICRKGEIEFVQLSRQVSYCMNTRRLEEVLQDLISGDRAVEYMKDKKRWFKKKGGQ